MTLHEQLRFYLELRQMTAAELARRSNISPQTISHWLNGSVARDINKAKRVADALGTTLDNLLFGVGLPSDRDRALEISRVLEEGHSVKGLFEVQIKMVKPK